MEFKNDKWDHYLVAVSLQAFFSYCSADCCRFDSAFGFCEQNAFPARDRIVVTH